MRVNQSPRQPIQFQRESLEEGGMKTSDIVVAGQPFVAARIEPEILYFLLPSSPSQFETSQAMVFERRPPKVQNFNLLIDKAFDPFPHHQVVGTDPLKPFIGSPELENRRTAEMAENGGSDRAHTLSRKRSEAISAFHDVFVDVQEK